MIFVDLFTLLLPRCRSLRRVEHDLVKTSRRVGVSMFIAARFAEMGTGAAHDGDQDSTSDCRLMIGK